MKYRWTKSPLARLQPLTSEEVGLPNTAGPKAFGTLKLLTSRKVGLPNPTGPKVKTLTSRKIGLPDATGPKMPWATYILAMPTRTKFIKTHGERLFT